MNVFIDTSIYLRFFEYSKDDLEELRKIEALSKKGKITVFVTQQILDEHDRRRPAVIRESIDRFAKGNLGISFPMLVEPHPDSKAAKELAGKFEKLRDKITTDVLGQAKSRELVHDKVIDGIHATAKLIPMDREILMAAQMRAQLGNPPGKGSN